MHKTYKKLNYLINAWCGDKSPSDQPASSSGCTQHSILIFIHQRLAIQSGKKSYRLALIILCDVSKMIIFKFFGMVFVAFLVSVVLIFVSTLFCSLFYWWMTDNEQQQSIIIIINNININDYYYYYYYLLLLLLFVYYFYLLLITTAA